MKLGLYLGLIICFLPTVVRRPDNTQTFYVASWKQGDVKIEEQKLFIDLTRSNAEYQKTINDFTGKPRYIIQVRHWPLKKGIPLNESWWIDLCEFRKPNRKIRWAEDCKLLAVEGRGHGDNFPKEDNIGWLYPLEKPDFFKDGVSAYPILSKRVIKVDGFYCIIQVTSYRMSQNNPRAVDNLRVEVEITNRYEP